MNLCWLQPASPACAVGYLLKHHSDALQHALQAWHAMAGVARAHSAACALSCTCYQCMLFELPQV
jgi:hypothetical protein